MQRLMPIITIWVVEFTDKNYGTFLDQEHFLFYQFERRIFILVVKMNISEDLHIAIAKAKAKGASRIQSINIKVVNQTDEVIYILVR